MLIISIIHSFRFSCFRCLVPGLGTTNPLWIDDLQGIFLFRGT